MAQARKVKVGIRIKDDSGARFPREWLWAEVVHESSREGVYCLLNNAFYAPFAFGDLVEARRRKNGERIVKRLHRRGGRTAHLLWFQPTVSTEQIQQFADEWAATGTWVEGPGGGIVTVAVERLAGGRPDETDLQELARRGLLQQLMLMTDPDDTPDSDVFKYLVTAA